LTTLVTDEVLAMIGHTVTYVAPEPLGPAAIRYFAIAVGSDPDRWVDEAPPTLVCETNQLTGIDRPDGDGYLGHVWSLPFPVPVTMIRGGNDYRFHRPVRPADRITTAWRLEAVDEHVDRTGEPLAVVTAEARYRDADGEALATNVETLIYRPAGNDPGRGSRPGRAAGLSRARDGAHRSANAGGRSAAPLRDRATSAGRPVQVGERLPDLVRRVELFDLVAYGAATWDWHRLHYDPDRAARAGLAQPVVDGQLFGGLLAEQVMRALDRDDRLIRLHFRNRRPVFPGSELRCEAEVTEADDAGFVIAQSVMVDGQTVVDQAGAVVRYGLTRVRARP